MKYLDGKLFIEFSEMVDCGVSELYLRSARSKGIKSLKFEDDPEDRRKVLVEYEPLNAKYKEKIQARFGNPYNFISREPIRRMVIHNTQAELFYLNYRFENGQPLPTDYVKKYTICCNWLEMLLQVEKDKSSVKKNLHISLADFYRHIAEIINEDNIALPTKYQRLKEKIYKYRDEGYEGLIEKWRFTNQFAAKVKDELCTSVLLELIADNSQHDDIVVARAYNKWAKLNGYQVITDRTVGNHRRANEWQLQPYRDGNKVWYNNYGKQLLRRRPSAPLLLVGGDGNDWDMFFQCERNNQVYYFDKYVLVIIMDAYNDYVLGWSIGKSESIELIKAAWFDALQHIKELTGEFYLPHQLQTDRFAYASMKDWYCKLVENYQPAAAKAPRGKYIERAFGTTWHQILKQYKNWSGHNITAVSKINTDRIALEKKNFPHTSEAFNYALDFINQLRNISTKEGETKQQQWLKAFKENQICKQRHISYEQFLFNFGTYNSNWQKITNRGLTVIINNHTYLYDIPDENYLLSVGKQVQIVYDPYDMDRVLITDGRLIRFIASVPYLLPAAKADYQQHDEQRFWHRLQLKKQHLNTIVAAKTKREQVLNESGINPEALLQAGVLVKEIKQRAEHAYQNQLYIPPKTENSSYPNFDPLDQM